MRWEHTLGDILAANESITATMSLNGHQRKHLSQIARCHTAYYGESRIDCLDCGHQHFIYHSCRNRHCPSCQGSKREEWIARQQQYLLDVPYFHVVFTLPHELNQLCMHQPRLIYNLLFHASWKTISTFSNDHKYLGAKTGMTAVLHTWSQNLCLHPHLHCIVPGGGVTKNNKWKTTRSKGKYLFPAKAMAKVFRSIFLSMLKKIVRSEVLYSSSSFSLDKLYRKKWVVYAKRPFVSPKHVIEYLGRYTHKIAISNYRIIKVDDQSVTFKYKDYRDAAKIKYMTLNTKEFIRRIALHIMPHRFVRIRHYGILSFHGRSKTIPLLQIQQGFKPILIPPTERPKSELITQCIKCNSINLIYLNLTEDARAP